jgi:hypothetical protein
LIDAFSAVVTRFVLTLIVLSAKIIEGVVAIVAHAVVTSMVVFATGVGVAFEAVLLALVDVGADLAVAAETRLAIALETAANICAFPVLGTIVETSIFALVDVVTFVAEVTEVLVARVAFAGVTPGSVRALRVVLVAPVGFVLALIDICTCVFAVAAVTWLAVALVRAGGVGAHAIGVANVLVLFALINLHTSEFIALLQAIASVTHALVGTFRVFARRLGRALVRVQLTFVYILVAQASVRCLPSRLTLAEVAVLVYVFVPVDACAVIALNAVDRAGVCRSLTTATEDLSWAFACGLANLIFAHAAFGDTPRTLIAAVKLLTLVDLHTVLAVALVAMQALALVGAGGVGACGVGRARLLFLTLVDLLAAVGASVAG